MFQLSLFEAEEEKANTALPKMIATVAAKDKVTAVMLGLLQFLFGALASYYNYLVETLSEGNKLRHSPGFMALANCGINKFAVRKFPWESSHSSVIAAIKASIKNAHF